MFGWEFFLVLEMLRTRKSSFSTKKIKMRNNVYTVDIKVCTIYTVIIKINEI